MFIMLLLAHVLGDYVLQPNVLARWKARSALGVLVHGSVVTLVTLLCAVVVAMAWWPYALLIGLLHTGIDLARLHLIRPVGPARELLWYLADQGAHLATIGLVVRLSGASAGAPSWYGSIALLALLFLLQPAWVLLRFVVRGLWGAAAAPPLGTGEKVPPMLERVVIAGLAFLGWGYLAPLVLLPRRLPGVQVQGDALILPMVYPTHWAETLLGTALALSVGWALRLWLGR